MKVQIKKLFQGNVTLKKRFDQVKEVILALDLCDVGQDSRISVVLWVVALWVQSVVVSWEWPTGLVLLLTMNLPI